MEADARTERYRRPNPRDISYTIPPPFRLTATTPATSRAFTSSPATSCTPEGARFRAGTDKNLKRVALGGNPNIGPIYVEGALPGDTLVVHLIKIEPNRKTARQGSRIQQFGVTPAYNLAANYDSGFNGDYKLDTAICIAVLTAPTPALKNFKVTMKPMLGCISVAPPGFEALTGPHLGVFGGNLDYHGTVSGTTMFFPVFHPGALFRIRRWPRGDGRRRRSNANRTRGLDGRRKSIFPDPR